MGHQLALTVIEGVKLLEALGLPRDLVSRVERFEIIGEPMDAIRLNVTFALVDDEIPAVGSVFADYELRRRE